jgi:DNA mismatch repair protein MutL
LSLTMPIKALDKEIIARIAAGEVVERPASVVKELVENSLDAGATQISVEVGGGGINLIRVTDNGVGIPSGEIELAFDRYATSKIGSLDDLESILSLGFRGEALSSIAAVAEIDIVTCATGEPIGISLSLKDGVVVNRQGRGRSPGTTVAVKGLLRKMPARLKFLKSLATENSHIANVVSRYAFAFPEVRFILSLDGRVTLRTPGSGRLIDSVAQVYGLEVAENMLEIKEGGWQSGVTPSSPSVTGMVGSPAISRSNRDYLSLFVNRRWMSHRRLAWAVQEAYHGLLMSGKHPVAVVNLALPPAEVDVNIHPAKAEVKFRNEAAVFSAVQKAVRQTLVELTPVSRIEEVTPRRGVTLIPRSALPVSAKSGGLATSQPAEFPLPILSLPVLRVVGQLLSSYIIAEGPDGLYLIDQHAAHERILFEKVEDQRLRQGIEVQGLIEPVTFEVSPKQGEALKARYESLAEFGFSMEPFGERTVLVRAVPALLASGDWAGMLRELLDSDGGQVGWEEKIGISLACHGAVRAGQALTFEEMRGLVRQLEQAALPHTCPHGRPTMIHLSLGQLRKEFGRS